MNHHVFIFVPNNTQKNYQIFLCTSNALHNHKKCNSLRVYFSFRLAIAGKGLFVFVLQLNDFVFIDFVSLVAVVQICVIGKCFLVFSLLYDWLVKPEKF